MIWIYTMPIAVEHRREVANLGIRANFYIAGGSNAGTLVNEDPIANLELSMWLSSSNFSASNAAAQYEPSTDLDFPGTVQYRQPPVTSYE
jgi:hypothetical protein